MPTVFCLLDCVQRGAFSRCLRRISVLSAWRSRRFAALFKLPLASFTNSVVGIRFSGLNSVAAANSRRDLHSKFAKTSMNGKADNHSGSGTDSFTLSLLLCRCTHHRRFDLATNPSVIL